MNTTLYMAISADGFIANFLHRGLSGHEFADEVTAFVNKYRTAHYSFDNQWID